LKTTDPRALAAELAIGEHCRACSTTPVVIDLACVREPEAPLNFPDLISAASPLHGAAGSAQRQPQQMAAAFAVGQSKRLTAHGPASRAGPARRR
jgi:hypothetical protein